MNYGEWFIYKHICILYGFLGTPSTKAFVYNKAFTGSIFYTLFVNLIYAFWYSSLIYQLLYYLIPWTFMLLLGDNLIKAAFGWGFLIITYFIIYLCSSSKWGFSLYKLLRPSNVTTQTHVLRNFNPTFLVKSFYYTQRPWSLKNSFLCAWKFDWT